MADLTQIPLLLKGLEDIIRTIERESSKPCQLVVKLGDDGYLVGDLTTRSGEYRLEMDGAYVHFVEGVASDNPYKRLTGTYGSFDQLKQAIESANPNTEKTGSLGSQVPVIGLPGDNFLSGIPRLHLGHGGQMYVLMGRIVFPLLQNDEKIDIKKIDIEYREL